jgi:hypothetical protein
MKRFFSILVAAVCLSASFEASAQNDTYLISNPQNARWSYRETDSNGKHVLTIHNSIESIEGDGVNGSIKILVEEVPVASPKEATKSYAFYRFKNGEYMADMSAGFEYTMFEGGLDSLLQSTIQKSYPDLPEDKKQDVIEKTKAEFLNMKGETRGIPRYPTVGKLPDYECYMKVSLVSMKVTGTDRKIVGKESIQTSAGVFDCFVLEETITIKSMMMKDVEKIKSWYAYGIGLVKEITYDKNGKLISTMTLSEL